MGTTKVAFEFKDISESKYLDKDTRALVKLKDGTYTIAVYLGDKIGWNEEGVYCHGNITDQIEMYSIIK